MLSSLLDLNYIHVNISWRRGGKHTSSSHWALLDYTNHNASVFKLIYSYPELKNIQSRLTRYYIIWSNAIVLLSCVL